MPKGSRRGYYFGVAQSMDEPAVKRAVAFFDGQNIYRHAKAAFGYHHPNFDPIKLTEAICAVHKWQRGGVRFYTGTPEASEDPMWHRYWSNRLLAMSRSGILVTKRVLRYQRETVTLQDGTEKIVTTAHEKGIDVRLALDVVRLARQGQLDVAIIFSQDQDLSELAEEVQEIASTAARWIKVMSAFPSSDTASARRGIDKTDWFAMDKAFYDACLDPRDYR
jgi:uncharacterized LabA/DUF88 family protein